MDYKQLVLGFTSITFLWESYLSYRQRAKLYEKKVPKQLESIVTEKEFHKSNAYSLDKSKFGVITSTFGFVQQVIVFLFNLIPYFWDLSGSVLEWFGYSSKDNEVCIPFYC